MRLKCGFQPCETEFEGRTINYGPRFLLIDLRPKSKRKNEDPYLTVRTEKTRSVSYFLYLYCVSDGFQNGDFYSRGTASNFFLISKAKRATVNLKLFLSRQHALITIQSKRKFLTFTWRKINETVWQQSQFLNFSRPCRRIRSAKLPISQRTQ